MYLSRLALNGRCRDVQRDLADPYQLHRTLSRGWGQGTEYQEARVLFRVEEGSGACPIVLVQSKVAPDWSRLPSKYFGAAPQMKEWQAQWEAGQSLRFRLQANPTFAPKLDGARNGTRRGLFREAERLDWLRRQGESHGFVLPLRQVTLRPGEANARNGGQSVPLIFRGRQYDELALDLPAVEVVDLNDGRRFSMPSRAEQFSAARFDGVLRVTDTTQFARAVECGIGKARGFGFGLLSIARA